MASTTTPSSAEAAHPVRTHRFAFRPGVHVARRSADELQVGLDPDRAVVLADLPSTRAVLAGLASPAALPTEEYDAATLEVLRGAGLVMDADELLPLVPADDTARSSAGTSTAGRGPARADAASVAAAAGEGAAAVLARRAAATVEVRGSGSAQSTALTGEVARLLTDAGVTVARHAGQAERAPRRGGVTPRQRPDVAVLVAVGEPARELLDDWVRLGICHLVLRITEGKAVIGPFVRPGATACLRCVDAHHTDTDAAWPLLVAQYAAAVRRPRDDTVPEPVDSLLAALAAAWAARELVTYAEGKTPATTGTTLRLDPDLQAIATQSWPQHPACGCSWS